MVLRQDDVVVKRLGELAERETVRDPALITGQTRHLITASPTCS
jgi:hypothetical protein